MHGHFQTCQALNIPILVHLYLRVLHSVSTCCLLVCSGSRAAKVLEKEWQQRLQQQEQQWALKQEELEKRWAARLVEAGRQARAQAGAAEQAQQQQLHSLQAQHANHLRQLQSKAQQSDWQAANEKALLQK